MDNMTGVRESEQNWFDRIRERINYTRIRDRVGDAVAPVVHEELRRGWLGNEALAIIHDARDAGAETVLKVKKRASLEIRSAQTLGELWQETTYTSREREQLKTREAFAIADTHRYLLLEAERLGHDVSVDWRERQRKALTELGLAGIEDEATSTRIAAESNLVRSQNDATKMLSQQFDLQVHRKLETKKELLRIKGMDKVDQLLSQKDFLNPFKFLGKRFRFEYEDGENALQTRAVTRKELHQAKVLNALGYTVRFENVPLQAIWQEIRTLRILGGSALGIALEAARLLNNATTKQMTVDLDGVRRIVTPMLMQEMTKNKARQIEKQAAQAEAAPEIPIRDQLQLAVLYLRNDQNIKNFLETDSDYKAANKRQKRALFSLEAQEALRAHGMSLSPDMLAQVATTVMSEDLELNTFTAKNIVKRFGRTVIGIGSAIMSSPVSKALMLDQTVQTYRAFQGIAPAAEAGRGVWDTAHRVLDPVRSAWFTYAYPLLGSMRNYQQAHAKANGLQQRLENKYLYAPDAENLKGPRAAIARKLLEHEKLMNFVGGTIAVAYGLGKTYLDMQLLSLESELASNVMAAHALRDQLGPDYNWLEASADLNLAAVRGANPFGHEVAVTAQTYAAFYEAGAQQEKSGEELRAYAVDNTRLVASQLGELRAELIREANPLQKIAIQTGLDHRSQAMLRQAEQYLVANLTAPQTEQKDQTSETSQEQAAQQEAAKQPKDDVIANGIFTLDLNQAQLQALMVDGHLRPDELAIKLVQLYTADEADYEPNADFDGDGILRGQMREFFRENGINIEDPMQQAMVIRSLTDRFANEFARFDLNKDYSLDLDELRAAGMLTENGFLHLEAQWDGGDTLDLQRSTDSGRTVQGHTTVINWNSGSKDHSRDTLSGFAQTYAEQLGHPELAYQIQDALVAANKGTVIYAGEQVYVHVDEQAMLDALADGHVDRGEIAASAIHVAIVHNDGMVDGDFSLVQDMQDEAANIQGNQALRQALEQNKAAPNENQEAEPAPYSHREQGEQPTDLHISDDMLNLAHKNAFYAADLNHDGDVNDQGEMALYEEAFYGQLAHQVFNDWTMNGYPADSALGNIANHLSGMENGNNAQAIVLLANNAEIKATVEKQIAIALQEQNILRANGEFAATGDFTAHLDAEAIAAHAAESYLNTHKLTTSLENILQDGMISEQEIQFLENQATAALYLYGYGEAPATFINSMYERFNVGGNLHLLGVSSELNGNVLDLTFMEGDQLVHYFVFAGENGYQWDHISAKIVPQADAFFDWNRTDGHWGDMPAEGTGDEPSDWRVLYRANLGGDALDYKQAVLFLDRSATWLFDEFLDLTDTQIEARLREAGFDINANGVLTPAEVNLYLEKIAHIRYVGGKGPRYSDQAWHRIYGTADGVYFRNGDVTGTLNFVKFDPDTNGEVGRVVMNEKCGNPMKTPPPPPPPPPPPEKEYWVQDTNGDHKPGSQDASGNHVRDPGEVEDRKDQVYANTPATVVDSAGHTASIHNQREDYTPGRGEQPHLTPGYHKQEEILARANGDGTGRITEVFKGMTFKFSSGEEIYMDGNNFMIDGLAFQVVNHQQSRMRWILDNGNEVIACISSDGQIDQHATDVLHAHLKAHGISPTIDWAIWTNGPPPCFLAGTEISMANGSQSNIEDVSVGDKVKAFDQKTGKIVNSSVTKTFVHPETKGYLVITLGANPKYRRTLKVTPEHLIWVNNAYWRPAGKIKVGDSLRSQAGRQIKVAHIEQSSEVVTTYNFEVDTYHTYLAEKLVVHNDKEPCPPNPRPPEEPPECPPEERPPKEPEC